MPVYLIVYHPVEICFDLSQSTFKNTLICSHYFIIRRLFGLSLVRSSMYRYISSSHVNKSQRNFVFVITDYR